MSILGTFNNREKAIGIWLFIFLTWAFTKKEVRESIRNVFKSIFLTKLSSVFLGILIYTALVVFLLSKIKIWDIFLIKDTIFWIFGTGFILLMNINKATQGTSYFKNILLDSLKLTVVLEFIVSLYSSSFWVEMILMPLLFFVVVMNAYAGIKEEYKPVKKLTNWILVIFGIYTLVFAFSQALQNYYSLATVYNLRVFILPPILTISYIPFLYFFALIITYEILFVRLDILIRKDIGLAKFAKWKILILCSLNLGKLNAFVEANNKNFIRIREKNDIINMIKKSKRRK